MYTNYIYLSGKCFYNNKKLSKQHLNKYLYFAFKRLLKYAKYKFSNLSIRIDKFTDLYFTKYKFSDLSTGAPQFVYSVWECT